MALIKSKKKKAANADEPEKIGSEEILSDDDIVSEDADNGGKKKKKKEKKPKKEKKKDGKGVGRFIPLFIFLLIAGALVATVGFNVFGVRDKYVNKYAMGLLEKIPIVGSLLPQPSSETVSDEYSGLTREELVAQIQQLKDQLAAAQENATSLQRRNDNYVTQLQGLQEIEAQQTQIKADKEEFDRMIAVNDPSAYSKFYESIAPENAAALYQEAVTATQISKELKNYVATFKNMSESDAAKVLEEMISTRMNLVVLILNNIDNATRGAILGAMEPKNAASVATQLAPTGQQ